MGDDSELPAVTVPPGWGDDTTDSSTAKMPKQRFATAGRHQPAGRPQLVVLEGQKVGQTFPLQTETVIGRKADCHIRLEDAEVSRRHALIRRIGPEEMVLEDLGSRNGTMVNGIPVDMCKLALGDRIQLGSRVLLQLTRYEPIEDQLRHRQRLETLGRLAAGFAHDLNNMLTVITTNLDLLEQGSSDSPPSEEASLECIADIRKAAAHAAKLTPRFLAFARPDQRSVGTVDVSSMCEEVALIARRTFGSGIRVTTDIARGLEVLGSMTDLHQALMNLCINARDAMPQGGQLAIHAALKPAKEESASRVVINVQDSGEGMDEATRKRIFEPFFTTKREGGGSGLGLATVCETVKAHGGEIDVRSKVGTGSTFTIRLPTFALSRTAPGDTLPPASSAEPARRRRVLVIDDEAMVRTAMRRLLERHGYVVTEARAWDEAMDAYTSGQRPDAVILDLEVPRSERTLEELVALDADARIVVHTSRDILVEHLGPNVHRLSKPALAAELLRAVDAVLAPAFKRG